MTDVWQVAIPDSEAMPALAYHAGVQDSRMAEGHCDDQAKQKPLGPNLQTAGS